MDHGERNNAGKKSFLSRMGNRLKTIMGTWGITDRMEDTFSPWKRAHKENMDRLRSNLENAEDMEKWSFEEIMANWGITTPFDLERYVKAKKQSIGAGAFLFLLGGVGIFFQSKAGIVGFLSAFSCASVATLGAVLMAAGLWRLQIIKSRRFIPFDRWILIPVQKVLNKAPKKP